MAKPNLIYYDIEPDPEIIESLLLQAADHVDDMVGPLEASRGILAAGIHRRFISQSDPDGVPWEDWSESYYPKVMKKIASGVHKGRILQESLELQQAAESEYSFFVSYDSVFFTWDTLPEYGAVQNFGGPVGNGAILPARPFVGVDELDEERVETVFAQWMDESLRISGSGRGGMGRFVSLKGITPLV